MLIAVTPAGGISQSTGAPVAAGSTVAVYRLDPGGSIASLGLQTLYNISTVEAVPASVLATIDVSENGHYFCRTWATQAYPAQVIHSHMSPGHKGF